MQGFWTGLLMVRMTETHLHIYWWRRCVLLCHVIRACCQSNSDCLRAPECIWSRDWKQQEPPKGTSLFQSFLPDLHYPMDVVWTLAQDPQVIGYFVCLGYSILHCFRNSKKSWPLMASLGFMSVTWFYICRWTAEYKRNGGNNLFDDAYVDVVTPPHWGFSSQLLTWVVVASIWMHEASIFYMLFGMLGAMSAAFITWVPNKPQSSRYVPVSYVITSVLALIAIFHLPRTVSSPKDFNFWLLLLHVMLPLPQFLSLLVPWLYKIEGTFLYAFVGAAIAVWYWVEPIAYARPVTDCQLSITYDLILCSLITLYAINIQTKSHVMSAMAGLLMPVLSPGAVLAFYLAFLHGEGIHARTVSFLQKYFAQCRRSNVSQTPYIWMNLGQGWNHRPDIDYDRACEDLAMTLGAAVLQTGDGVLACGCGYGAELMLWKDRFNLGHITGIDCNEEASEKFCVDENIRLLPVSIENMLTKFRNAMQVNKILALDSVYHYANKTTYYRDCHALLNAGGSVGVTDLILKSDSASNGSVPFWLRILLWLMNVKVNYLWTADQYKTKLEAIGWTNVSIDSMSGEHVLDGWFPGVFLRYLDYAVVVAHKPVPRELPRRPKVAIIGSGLSGLTTAHLLSGTHDVTLLEANERGGLSGQGEDIYGQIVDIPLRIIGRGYYTYVENLARDLDVKIGPIRDDFLTQQNYGSTGPFGAPVSFSYSHSWLKNLISTIPHAMDIYRFHNNVYHDVDADAPDELWGQWMIRHGYDIRPYVKSNGDSSHTWTTGRQVGEPTTHLQDSSFIMWMVMGQASWMLSCTYEQVLNYPAPVLLSFIRSLGWGGDVADTVSSSASRSGRMLRIRPSMRALEHALTYGVRTMYSTRVGGIDESLTINGETFDYIVIATEASAVKHVLHPNLSPEVFSRVKYHPSSIYLHRDPTLMPENKSDWRAFNICQENDQDMCMLTAWLNEYYPDAKFPVDVFETWNPHRIPNDIMKVCHFLRVCHTKDTADILLEIQDLQGVHGIYYAGAYSVDGMGLLEQAARSGRKVAEMILRKSAATAWDSEQYPSSSSRQTDSLATTTPAMHHVKLKQRRNSTTGKQTKRTSRVGSHLSSQDTSPEPPAGRRQTRSMVKKSRHAGI